jgi:hypothetical protein
LGQKGPSGQKKDLRVITKEKDLRVKKGPSGHKQRTGHLVLNWLEEKKKMYNNFSVGPDLSLLTNPDEGPTWKIYCIS